MNYTFLIHPAWSSGEVAVSSIGFFIILESPFVNTRFSVYNFQATAPGFPPRSASKQDR